MIHDERWGANETRWAAPAEPRASVLLLHGYSEHSGRYLHVIEALVAAGFAVAAPDHRGHGRTGPVLGLSPDAAVWLDDLAVTERALASRAPGRPMFVVGCSLGGLLALRLLQVRPASFAGAVLQAPAVSLPESVGTAQQAVLRWLGRWWPSLPVRPYFNPPKATRDEAFQRWMREDPYTYRGWIRAGTAARSMAMMADVDAGLAAIRHPVLLTHGGDDERVAPATSARLAERLGGPVERVVFPGLRHEAHQEPEREQVVGAWVRWLDQQVRAGAVEV